MTHLQYVDDTVIMVHPDEKSISAMKFILYCFEWMSGLKINYHKSEIVVFGCEKDEEQRIANMLNYKVGKFPMKYLGVPISDHHSGVRSFFDIQNKMRKKLQPWKGKHMSYGGRLILTNTSLSSLPVYTMGMYLLQDTIHKNMDSIRGRFFGVKKKTSLSIIWLSGIMFVFLGILGASV